MQGPPVAMQGQPVAMQGPPVAMQGQPVAMQGPPIAIQGPPEVKREKHVNKDVSKCKSTGFRSRGRSNFCCTCICIYKCLFNVYILHVVLI